MEILFSEKLHGVHCVHCAKIFHLVVDIFRSGMKVYIESYGCTANAADAAAMREAIAAAGGLIVDNPAEADTVIVNTCAVTHYTSNAMLRAIARH
jgi:hypothetical protein